MSKDNLVSGLPGVKSAGYPMVLEACAIALVVAQVWLSWMALDRLPSTVVPYFGLGRTVAGLPGSGLEARVWIWTVIGLWALFAGASVVLYRALGSSPIPVASVALFAHLAVLRAGMIGLNLNPGLTPSRVVIRALVVGVVALLLAAAAERHRTRKRLVGALLQKPKYDEPTPRGIVYACLASMVLPVLLLPLRIRLVDQGLVAITPVGHLFIPTQAIESCQPVGPARALFGSGINLISNVQSAVVIRRRRRIVPIAFSVVDRPRFLETLGVMLEDKKPQ